MVLISTHLRGDLTLCCLQSMLHDYTSEINVRRNALRSLQIACDIDSTYRQYGSTLNLAQIICGGNVSPCCSPHKLH